ncbi:MAG: FKBP-type peptidyl-prolyl cis-trans isomerase [Chloroflexi bacterium]|nr:FKBP-type peptidyl-prolyl cis-trans isomerase [Chloroflexota bacterium]
MKSGLLASLSLGIICADLVQAAEKVELKDQKSKVSYVIGLSVGKNFKQQTIDIDPETFARGFKDGLSGGDSSLTEAEMREVMTGFQAEMMAKQEERKKLQTEKNKQSAEKNQKEGQAFLAENKKKEGVTTLPSGLQYRILKEGTGPSPRLSDTVVTHYRGTLIDGAEFDSSAKQGQPASFSLDGVIKGWTEALQLMKVGAKWQLFIPPDLAYGEQGAGAVIGPNATLIFDIELVSIEKPSAKPAP